MKVINVYEQYFAARCVYNGVERRAAAVRLTATSDSGEISYEVSVSFFPHEDETDFRISYDAYAAKELYRAKGRRSKKREAVYLEELRAHTDEVAASLEGEIFWEQSLIEARMA